MAAQGASKCTSSLQPLCKQSRRSILGRCRAREDRSDRARIDQLRRERAKSQPGSLPETGYFQQADPNAPLYKPFAGNGSGDVTQRSTNRWESDYIWNTKWQDRMDYEAKTQEEQKRLQEQAKQQESGFLSLSRVNDLNSLDVDISAQLNQGPEKVNKELPVPIIQMVPRGGDNSASRIEAERYRRSEQFLKRSAPGSSSAQSYSEEAEARIAAERASYEDMKRKNSLYTTASAAVCFAIAYSVSTRDVAASYLLGALGGILYLRLLNRSVDSLAGSSFADVVGGSIGQPRLIIPVVLILFYNRFNFLYADSFQMHLELLPMILGFFTYKVGVVTQGAVSMLQEMRKSSGPGTA